MVYSFGVGGEISWDNAMRVFNCSVYAFDMTLMSWRNSILAENFHFLDIGLSKFDSDVSGDLGLTFVPKDCVLIRWP